LKSVETTNINSSLFQGVGPTHPTSLLQISRWDFTFRYWNQYQPSCLEAKLTSAVEIGSYDNAKVISSGVFFLVMCLFFCILFCIIWKHLSKLATLHLEWSTIKTTGRGDGMRRKEGLASCCFAWQYKKNKMQIETFWLI